MYKIDILGNIIKIETGQTLGIDPANVDYQAYLVWLDEGNTPQPYVPPVVDPKEQARADLAATDKEMARIAEDLINVMLTKDLITESDIPQSAHDKMARRAKLRSRLA